jgi:putative phage-type endonuclease
MQHKLEQGGAEWHQFRAEHFGASEASAMLGLSPYMTRSDLLKTKATGITQDIDAYTQRVFDLGHEVEALARPIIEERIGDDLYPITSSIGKLSASCDGLTICGSIAWENKQFNAKLFAAIQAGELPAHHWPQAQQVLYVTGADKLIFTCSDGTPENTVSMDVFPDTELHQRLVEGWTQFAKDLAEYVPVEVIEAPKAKTIMQLPAINVQVTGGLTVSNLKTVIVQFDEFIDSANVVLVTDDDFANGNATAKFSREQAKKLKVCRQQIIDQVADISEATRIIDLYAGKFDALGLKLEKLVKTETENRKLQILQAAKHAWHVHTSMIEIEIVPIKLQCQSPGFAEAMKGKRTIFGWQDAVDGALATGKIAVDAIGRDIRSKLTWFEQYMPQRMLFSDLQNIIYKPADDFKLTVETRIAEHKKAEADKLEMQRIQIQAEEEAKAKRNAEAEQAEKLEAERAVIKVKSEQDEKAKAELVAEIPEEVKKISDLAQIRTDPGRAKPTRVGLINAVANEFGVSATVAEAWLVDEFLIA